MTVYLCICITCLSENLARGRGTGCPSNVPWSADPACHVEAADAVCTHFQLPIQTHKQVFNSSLLGSTGIGFHVLTIIFHISYIEYASIHLFLGAFSGFFI